MCKLVFIDFVYLIKVLQGVLPYPKERELANRIECVKKKYIDTGYIDLSVYNNKNVEEIVDEIIFQEHIDIRYGDRRVNVSDYFNRDGKFSDFTKNEIKVLINKEKGK